MKLGNLLLPLMVTACPALADGLPVITSHPQSQTIAPGVSVTFTVVSTNATAFQWRFNGADLSGATSSALQIASPQSTDTGYYMVVAKNATGWVPSQIVWLSVVSGSGGVPFSNQTNSYWQGQACDYFGNPLNNCSATVVAGPALDQMQPVSTVVHYPPPFPSVTNVISAAVNNGYFQHANVYVPSVSPGQTVYYRVDIAPSHDIGKSQSTVLKLTAGGGGNPIPSAYGLKFPGWWVGEGVEPTGGSTTPTNQVRIPGETFSLANGYFAYTDYGTPTAQWRKNGSPILGATNFPNISPGYAGSYIVDGVFLSVLTVTNAQPDDAGVYDLVVLGDNWFIGPKTTVSIQLTNGPGVLLTPRISGSNFVCDLLGAAGRNYAIEWSSNLSAWNDLQTLANTTGTATFTNAPAPAGTRYYRSRLLP